MRTVRYLVSGFGVLTWGQDLRVDGSRSLVPVVFLVFPDSIDTGRELDVYSEMDVCGGTCKPGQGCPMQTTVAILPEQLASIGRLV